MVSQYSAKQQAPYLLLDAGNLLFKKRIVNKSSNKELITARAIIDICSAMKYDAIAVGPFDLGAGLDLLTEPDSLSSPWISANIYNLDGTRPFRPYLSINRGGLKIAVIGLTDKIHKEVGGIYVNSWQQELTTLLPSISPAHDLVILLSTLPSPVLKTIAEQFPDIKIIFGADRRKGNINGLLYNKTVIAQTAGQGKYLGQLSVNWRQRPWEEDHALKITTLKKQKLSIDRQRQLLEKNGSAGTPGYEDKRKYLEQKKEELREKISELETRLNKNLQTDLPSRFSASVIPLESKIPEDPQVREIIDSAEKSIREKKL